MSFASRRGPMNHQLLREVAMGKVWFQLSVSLDGFAAGPRQSVDDPLGVGGMRMFEWQFALEAWHRLTGSEGGEVNASTPVFEEALSNYSAVVMGRDMFGGGPGPWRGG